MIVPKGFFDPETIVPGFESLGHYLPQIDAEALRMLVRYACSTQHSTGGVTEIGSFVGASAAVLQSELSKIANVPMWCYDTWKGSSAGDRINSLYAEKDVHSVFCSNLKLIGSLFVTPGWDRMTSLEAAERYPAPSLDLVFIDADHSYEAVKADIAAWEPKVREGGVLAGHDYGVFPGVTRAVNERGFCGLIGSVWFRIKGLE